jgi:hypothetical protein
MEKILSATYDGKQLRTEETLDLPPNTQLRVIVEIEGEDFKEGNNGAMNLGTHQQNSNKLIRLLQSWRKEEDKKEQQETWE